MIVRLRCKNTMSLGGHPNYDGDADWEPLFIAGKWYDISVVPWQSENTARINGGGWKIHVGVGESGRSHALDRALVRAIFYYTEEEQREAKINEILNG